MALTSFMARNDREDSDDMEDEPPEKRCKVVSVPYCYFILLMLYC